MVLIGLYVGTMSSLYIAFDGRKHFDIKIFIKLIPLAILGSIIGVVIFSYLSMALLSLSFGLILLILALRMIFFERYKFPRFLKNKLLLTGAISQGAFGVGGPFVINAIHNDFKSKSSLRATMAVYFVFCNFIRILQLSFLESAKIFYFMEIWWVIIPVFIAIYFGHMVHLKIKDNVFKKGVAVITLLASFNFIIKAFK